MENIFPSIAGRVRPHAWLLRWRSGALNGLVAALLFFATVLPALASQGAVQIPTTGPLPGLTLVNDTNTAIQTLITLQSGGSPPTAAGLGLAGTAGVAWHDTNSNQIKVRNQADTAWVPLFQIDETNNLATPAVPLLASASGQTVGAANHYGLFVATAAAAYTLDQTATLPPGAAFGIFAQGGAVTVSINGADKINGGGAGVGTVVAAGYLSRFVTDGAGNWWVTTAPATLDTGAIASAATTDICAPGAPSVTITGTVTITSLGASCQAGQVIFVKFAGALTLTYNATALILPNGGANITTAAGDGAIVMALGSGDYAVLVYQRANGQALQSSTPAPAPDAFFNNVVALFNFNNSLADASGNAITLTNNGSVGFSTSPSKFDGSSLGPLNGSSQYLSASAATFAEVQANEDFTWEAWVYATANGQSGGSLIMGGSASGSLNLYLPSGGTTPTLGVSFSGNLITSSCGNISQNAWHFIAITRNGALLTIWVDGINCGTATNTTAYTTAGFYIGGEGVANGYFTGYIGPMRVTKAARYSAPFALPSYPFSSVAPAY